MNRNIEIDNISADQLHTLEAIRAKKEDVWQNICRQTGMNSTKQAAKVVEMPKKRWAWNVGIAAAVSALVGLGSLMYINSRTIDEIDDCANSYYASADKSVITLEDGTEVILAQGASIGYEFTDNERTVVLKGQACFDVAKDENRTFSVFLQGRDAKVEVLGTCFVIDNIDGRETSGVTVKRGHVRVNTPYRTTDLKYNERVIISGSAIEKLNISQTASVDWSTDKMDLRGATLSETVDGLLAMYPEIKNIKEIPAGLIKSETQTKVTSKFDKESLDNVLNELSMHFGIKMKFDGGSLIITR